MNKNKTVKKLVNVIMVFALAVSSMAISTKSLAAYSKKTITITLNENTPVKRYFIKTKDRASSMKKYKQNIVLFTAKIMNIKGKATSNATFFSEGEYGCGGLLPDGWKVSDYKKGKTINLTKSDPPGGWFYVDFDIPGGVKSITYKVTFKSKTGKRIIKSIQKKSQNWEFPQLKQ